MAIPDETPPAKSVSHSPLESSQQSTTLTPSLDSLALKLSPGKASGSPLPRIGPCGGGREKENAAGRREKENYGMLCMWAHAPRQRHVQCVFCGNVLSPEFYNWYCSLLDEERGWAIDVGPELAARRAARERERGSQRELARQTERLREAELQRDHERQRARERAAQLEQLQEQRRRTVVVDPGRPVTADSRRVRASTAQPTAISPPQIPRTPQIHAQGRVLSIVPSAPIPYGPHIPEPLQHVYAPAMQRTVAQVGRPRSQSVAPSSFASSGPGPMTAARGWSAGWTAALPGAAPRVVVLKDDKRKKAREKAERARREQSVAVREAERQRELQAQMQAHMHTQTQAQWDRGRELSTPVAGETSVGW